MGKGSCHIKTTQKWLECQQTCSYFIRSPLLGLDTLENRRIVAQCFFVFNVLTGHIDAPQLLSLLNIYVPSRKLRNRQFVYIALYADLYCVKDPLLLMIKTFNDYSSVILRCYYMFATFKSIYRTTS